MFHQLRRYFVALSCTAALLAAGMCTKTCSAATIIGATVPLSTLIDGGTITAGDKTFTNFNYSFTGDMPPAISVNVIPIQDDLGNFGIRFQGAFIDTTGVAGGSDALITYKVTAGDGFLITDAHLAGNPSRLGTLGSMSVTETFLPLGANGEYTMNIYSDQNFPTPKLMDSVVFATPVKSLNVQKDILGLAKVNPNSPTAPETVTLSFCDQTFSQVPEPTFGLLFVAGVIGMACTRRRPITA